MATVALGVYGGRLSRTTSDFLVASRSVGPRWNAAAISGEYLSAASFLGVAGLVAKYGADALWYPIGFTAGYLGLLMFVAAPLRRSGAYTVPDFTEFRLGSPRLRTATMLFVVVICVLYLGAPVPGRRPDAEHPSRTALLDWPGGGRHDRHRQRRRRRDAVHHVRSGLPILVETHRDRDPGPGITGVVPRRSPHARWAAARRLSMHASRSRSKPTLSSRWTRPDGITVSGTLDGRSVRDATINSPGAHTLGAGTTITLAAGAATPVVAGAPSTGEEWVGSGGGLGGAHPLYQVLSIVVATFLGTMGLPHVLVRFYTNPDGRAARRTALAVIALLSLFYAFPTLMGVFARLYVPQLLITGTADAAVLLMPQAALAGATGQLLAALASAGAIAAFLATSSGLLVSIAGALATDVLRGRVRDFRMAALIGGVLPLPLALAASTLELSRNVGLVFAVAASTLCPLLVLGIWWRGLTGDRRRVRAAGRRHRLRRGGGADPRRRNRREPARRLARGGRRLSCRAECSARVRDHGRGQPGDASLRTRGHRACVRAHAHPRTSGHERGARSRGLTRRRSSRPNNRSPHGSTA